MLCHNVELWLVVIQGESDAYISEIEAAGNAYEEMQGQNTRLLQQLTERDEQNNHLISERIKVIGKTVASFGFLVAMRTNAANGVLCKALSCMEMGWVCPVAYARVMRGA